GHHRGSAPATLAKQPLVAASLEPGRGAEGGARNLSGSEPQTPPKRNAESVTSRAHPKVYTRSSENRRSMGRLPPNKHLRPHFDWLGGGQEQGWSATAEST